ncbi:MAG: carbohydrate binding domain-containing protein [Marinilabiliaceae bacterium]|nr:carbohydrate binding domain-containing protein [Marinilabiliaceae bacterium]MBN2821170.1 carbohydrate binding domain-containing protein [Bacteroidales bacterium]
MKSKSLLILLFSIKILSAQTVEPVTFSLNTKDKGAEIKPTMYGLFFEDINFAADGGLYAEMVKNRSFDFPQNLMGWKSFGNVKVQSEDAPFPNNPNYIVFGSAGHKDKNTGIENEGFRGMGFKKGANYRFSVWAKKMDTDDSQNIRIELINSNNSRIGSVDLLIDSDEWKKYEVILQAGQTDPKGLMRIFFTSGGYLCLDHISLFPENTWKGRENGLRSDLAQALYDINPGVFRFPGGCIIEGTDLETRYDWKKSVGPVENRPLNENRWNYTFRHRLFPDYYQTYGLGFYEYFLLAEDMGAEPLPVVSVGLSCQYQNKGEHCHVAIEDLGSYVQDALDLIEFANGPVSSRWGKVRAEMGHSEPFNLKYIGIGNEQWGNEYPERLEVFVNAFREKYPEIKIIGSAGPTVDDNRFKHLWPEMKRLGTELVDEHYYKDPNWFLNNAARYDICDREGPAVFAGEYACHVPGRANNFYSALCEAAFMTGLERNADIVHMCTYAPLFAHVDGWQWRPDMIWFDNLSFVKTPNYYVQQMYAQNPGTHVLKLTRDNEIIAGKDGLYASAVYDANNKSYILKIANTGDQEVSINVELSGLSKRAKLTLGECKEFYNRNLEIENRIEEPFNIVPVATFPILKGNALNVKLKRQTFGLYRIDL